jgi:hypothetical protein
MASSKQTWAQYDNCYSILFILQYIVNTTILAIDLIDYIANSWQSLLNEWQAASPLSRILQPAPRDPMVRLLYIDHNNIEKQRVYRQFFPTSYEIEHANNQASQTPRSPQLYMCSELDEGIRYLERIARGAV